MTFDPKRIEWVSIVIGLIVISVFGQFLWLDVDFYVHSRVTVGEVTKLDSGGYHPQVTFIANTGKRITFSGSNSYPVEVGDRLEVRYSTVSPETQPRVDQSFDVLSLLPVVFGVYCVVAGLFGKFCLNFGKRNE